MQKKPFYNISYLKNSLASEASPGPRWGSSRRSPIPPSRLGTAPLPTPCPLGVWRLAYSEAPKAPI